MLKIPNLELFDRFSTEEQKALAPNKHGFSSIRSIPSLKKDAVSVPALGWHLLVMSTATSVKLNMVEVDRQSDRTNSRARAFCFGSATAAAHRVSSSLQL